jgi:hypothetical protein
MFCIGRVRSVSKEIIAHLPKAVILKIVLVKGHGDDPPLSFHKSSSECSTEEVMPWDLCVASTKKNNTPTFVPSLPHD